MANITSYSSAYIQHSLALDDTLWGKHCWQKHKLLDSVSQNYARLLNQVIVHDFDIMDSLSMGLRGRVYLRKQINYYLQYCPKPRKILDSLEWTKRYSVDNKVINVFFFFRGPHVFYFSGLFLPLAVADRSSNGCRLTSWCCCCWGWWNKLFESVKDRGGGEVTPFRNHGGRWTTLCLLRWLVQVPSHIECAKNFEPFAQIGYVARDCVEFVRILSNLCSKILRN